MSLKRVGVIAATAALVLSLSGCIRFITDITLHEDNTVSGEMVIAVQQGLGEQMGMSDEELASSLNADNGTDGMVNATVAPYTEDGYIGTRVTFSDEPVDNFTGVDGTITREGDTFVFKGSEVDQSEAPPAGSGAIATMSITFPGKVTDHNGELSGNTVTWDLLTITEAPYATGSAIGGGAGSTSPFVIIAGVVLLALIIVGVVLLRRRGGASPADDAAEGAADGTDEETKPTT